MKVHDRTELYRRVAVVANAGGLTYTLIVDLIDGRINRVSIEKNSQRGGVPVIYDLPKNMELLVDMLAAAIQEIDASEEDMTSN